MPDAPVTAPALYNLAPLLELMALGLLIALGPLLWVYGRNRGSGAGRRLQALTVLTLFLTFDLVLFGAFTRLTDSGLGCPDWPGCYGSASPLGAHTEIAAAQQAMPTGPVTHGKAWVEMIHRYLATGVGVLCIALTLGAWRQRRRGEAAAYSPWWPTLTLLWVCLQGAFGALTVSMRLFPAIVTLHLLAGLILLALLCVQAVRQVQFGQGQRRLALAGGLRMFLLLAWAAVLLQVALGGWVSTNYAVLVCSGFPQCQGAWWPQMAFAEGFELWRELGLRADGAHLSFAALTAIHYVHRLAAYGVLLLLWALVWRLGQQQALPVQRRWLLALSVLQLLTGLSNVILDWPLAAAVLHTGGAAALLLVLTWSLAASRSVVARRAPVFASGVGV